jgi:uncharacterized membrane protein
MKDLIRKHKTLTAILLTLTMPIWIIPAGIAVVAIIFYAAIRGLLDDIIESD